MKKLALYITIIGVAFICTNCQDVIQLELPDGEETLVIDFWYTTQNIPHVLKLNKTTNYFSDDAQPTVSDAVVVLEDQTAGTFDTLSEENPGDYVIDNPGQVDHTYVLHIALSDGNRYISNPELLYAVPELDTLILEFEEETTIVDAGWDINVTGVDPADVRNYYRWRTFINGIYQDDPFDINIAEDQFFNGSRVNNVTVERFKEGPNTAENEVQVGDTVTVEQMSVTADYYEYLSNLRRQTAFVGSIFDTPPEPISGNISHSSGEETQKPLGFFAVSDVSSRSAITEK